MLLQDKPLSPGYYMRAAPRVVDWSATIDFMPSSYHVPQSLDDLQAVLTALLRDPRGRSLRIMGGMHSCSRIFASDVVIDTSRLPLDFTVATNTSGGARVEASGWMHVHEFLRRAAEHDLSLTALGGTDAQTVAGLISTNTAGATVGATVYETLAWAEVMTVADSGQDLTVRRIARGDPDFNGLVASLGAIGLITRVAFDLAPQLFFEAGMRLRPVAEVLGDLDQTNAEYDFWRIEQLPKSELGNFWFAKRVPAADPEGDYPADQVVNVLRNILQFDDTTFHAGALLTPVLEASYGMLVQAYQNTDASGPMRFMIPVDRNAAVRVAMAEWSVAPETLPAVLKLCNGYFDEKGWPNLSTEIQCTRRDDFWMSGWNWPDVEQDYIVKLNFQYITNFLSEPEKAELQLHIRGLWDALDASGIAFKAHWGKINFLDAAATEARYQTAPFLKLVKPLFLNDYLLERLPLN